MLDAKKLHGDGTPVPVLCPGHDTIKQGRLWTYVWDEAYLRDVFQRIADHPITEIDELLPWNVVAQLPTLHLTV